jgi:hypothetical protein
MVEYAARACMLGFTDFELAQAMGIGTATLYRWKLEHPEFTEALQTGKVMADERVERSLYAKAVGYSFEAEEIVWRKGKPVRVPVIKHLPPDTVAEIFWLKNRRKEAWRDVHKHEVGPAGAFDHMTIDQLKASIAEDIRALDLPLLMPPAPEPAPSGVANRVPTNGKKPPNGG